MRRWFKIIMRLLILFALFSIIIYVFMPSNLSVQESIGIKCPPRLVFQKLADPNYWISRSKFFYNKFDRFQIDSSAKGKPYIYQWKNKNGTAGFVQQKESRRYESIIYQVNYEQESDGELILNLSYQKRITTVEASLEVELPNSIWKKVKVYLLYFSVKRNLRNELNSLAMDCMMNSKPLNITVKKGIVRDFKALIRKSYLTRRKNNTDIDELRRIYASIPKPTIVGHPFIQYANSPFNDTLIIITGVPVRNEEINRFPNSSLALFSRVETLEATFNIKETNLEDVYSLLASTAKEMGLVADGYPLIFVNLRKGTATMQLPISD